MTDNAKKAKEALENGGCTCVFCSGSSLISSTERGLRPLLARLNAGESLQGFAAADKVVGKAPAMLYVLLKPESVYAPVMSRAALQLLQQNGIEAAYGQLTDGILNRAGTGSCPMEAAVQGIDAPEKALEAIRQAIARMQAARP